MINKIELNYVAVCFYGLSILRLSTNGYYLMIYEQFFVLFSHFLQNYSQ